MPTKMKNGPYIKYKFSRINVEKFKNSFKKGRLLILFYIKFQPSTVGQYTFEAKLSPLCHFRHFPLESATFEALSRLSRLLVLKHGAIWLDYTVKLFHSRKRLW